jgi:hypothetical protein
MATRTCVNCGKDKDLKGGKVCEKGHFVCYACTSGIMGKKYCPLDGKELE